MARHFGAQHCKNNYAAMGGAIGAPNYGWMNRNRSIAASIESERRKAERMRKASTKKAK